MITYLFIYLFTYSCILFSVRQSNYIQVTHILIIYKFMFVICLFMIVLEIALF